jgi:signal transduction histidine kinase
VKDLSLHILDVAQNSLRHEAKLVEISVIEDIERDVLSLEIKDDGKGMDPASCARAADPFFTTQPGHRVGLGLALLAQAAREAGGEFHVASSPGAGTTVRATFRWSHPDRKPLGDIAATVETLVAGSQEVDIVCVHKKGEEIARFDTREVRQP